MTYETRQAYSEVCVVLDYMPNEYISKIDLSNSIFLYLYMQNSFQ